MPEPDKNKVGTGNGNIIKRTLETFSWIKQNLEVSFDKDQPLFMSPRSEPIWNGLVSLKKKGIKIRCVTGVTIDDISYCKKLLEVCGLCNLDGIRTNFGIIDGKEVMPYGISQETDPSSQSILTIVKGLVDVQQFMLKIWNNAIPPFSKNK